MKYLIMVLLLIGFSAGADFAQDNAVLKDQKDKESYSMGYQMGVNFKHNKIPINPESLARGLQDGLDEKKPLLSPTEMRVILSDLQKRMAESAQLLREQAAAKNLEESKQFLSQNSKKDGIVTLPSGLQYKVLKSGEGEIPKATDSVTVHYRGVLLNGSEFDSSFSRNQPATFKVSGVIPGWREALQLMKAGSKWQLFIPSALAYGERGAGPIPPNAALVFEVELIAVN